MKRTGCVTRTFGNQHSEAALEIIDAVRPSRKSLLAYILVECSILWRGCSVVLRRADLSSSLLRKRSKHELVRASEQVA